MTSDDAPSGHTLMVLGAGPFQVPAIQKAVRQGHRVVTVDYLPENPGHRWSHVSEDCSTVDKDGVLQLAKRHRIDGITTFSSDVAVPSVAHVASELGLPGPTPDVAAVLSNKGEFRRAMADLGVPPLFAVGGVTMPPPSTRQMQLPWIVKPVDSSGSRGVTRLDDDDAARFRNAVAHACAFSPSQTACVEEFVRGVEVGGDAIIMDGEIVFLAITHKHLDGFVVTGHSLPPCIGDESVAAVRSALNIACTHVGYTSGPLNFDVMVEGDRAVILEMSARTGGNGIPAVIALATGMDLEEWTIAWATGRGAVIREPIEHRGAGSVVLGAQSSGVFRSALSLDSLQHRVPELVDFQLAVRPGDVVRPFTHNGNLLGYAVFTCGDARPYDVVAQAVRRHADLRIATPQ